MPLARLRALRKIEAEIMVPERDPRETGTLIKVGFSLAVGFVVFGWWAYAALHHFAGL